jgi:hypothetical protein
MNREHYDGPRRLAPPRHVFFEASAVRLPVLRSFQAVLARAHLGFER